MKTNTLQALHQFSAALAQEGFDGHILEKYQDRPYDILLVFLPQEHHPAGGLQLELSFVPHMEEQLAGLSLMQFFVGLTSNLSSGSLMELQQAVISINRFCPLVGFGILSQPPMLCFRHTLMLPAKLEHSLPLVTQTTWLISYLMEVFGNNLTQVAEGHASIAQAFKEHPFAHFLT
jgi:hypothetical protein